MKDVLYSKELADLSTLVVIDGEVTKYRGHDIKEASIQAINEEKENYNNVLIQTGFRIDIYCKYEKSKHYKRIIKSLENMFGNTYINRINIYCMEDKE